MVYQTLHDFLVYNYILFLNLELSEKQRINLLFFPVLTRWDFIVIKVLELHYHCSMRVYFLHMVWKKTRSLSVFLTVSQSSIHSVNNYWQCRWRLCRPMSTIALRQLGIITNGSVSSLFYTCTWFNTCYFCILPYFKVLDFIQHIILLAWKYF